MIPDQDCGGCMGKGSHKRWCAAVVGIRAHIMGTEADRLEDIGDRLGPASMALANEVYWLATRLRVNAGNAKEDWLRRKEEQ